ncbi:MAG: hypothetical protein KKE30_13500 [Gammaproteobacteria bacterium]|nr:hypothetical protein [Gammaproteobacteria bacterium]MBU1553826.1 hypothetical protein [Gammaproteobacteria bacterium]MBU2070508.1 hypothetical protein [Gammaproteobacteria bacterium]MBU2185309.1 hypothetical protein [Gammaproteobacteria bacterium]MBU2205100.1 hypothetical protein [Gammaproteobacteria bacterium]
MNKFTMEINLKSHITQCWPWFMYATGCALLPICFGINSDVRRVDFSILFAIFFFLLFFTPELILHIRYSKLNKGLKIVSCRSSDKFTLVGPKSERVINLSLIEKVVLHLTLPVAWGGLRLLPASSYFYGLIHLRTGESILITTLLDSELAWLVDLAPDITEVNKRLYCWPESAHEI